LLALSLDQPAAAIAASMGKAKVSGNIVQRHEHGTLGGFSRLNDEERKESLYDATKELEELDPEFAEFAKQLAQQKRTTEH
jgi:coenzyme F420-reducing hydrogenase alpha subunit